MHHKLFSVRDTKANVFMKPFVAMSEVEASRTLQMAVNDEKIQLSFFPEDFELRYLGEFNDETGELISSSAGPKYIVSAIQLKRATERSAVSAPLEDATRSGAKRVLSREEMELEAELLRGPRKIKRTEVGS